LSSLTSSSSDSGVIIIIIVRVTKNAFYGTTTQKEA
jgi:hypothetical protein